MYFRLLWVGFLVILSGTLFAQPGGKDKAPFAHAVTTNPALPVVGHFSLAYDYRFNALHSAGIEYTRMGNALYQQEIGPDTIPQFFDSWLPANGNRLMLRYKLYPFYVDRKVRPSYFYFSFQFMYRQIEFPSVEISYFELRQTYRKKVQEIRRGGRLDFVVGADIPIGQYFLVGGYAGLGRGTEHVFQFNLEEHDLTGLTGPERQFLAEEPDYWTNLLDFRCGVVLGFTLPHFRR